MIGFTNCLSTLFVPISAGSVEYAYIAVSILIGILCLFLLTKVPNRWRRPIVVLVTFLAGWFYFIEFIIPASSEMMGVRKETIAAERLVAQAANDLGVIENRTSSNVSIKSSVSESRVARADKAMTSALLHLNKAKADLERVQPQFDRKIEAELKKADAFAKSHDLSEKMVEKDTYKGKEVIVNSRVKTLKKRANDVEEAYANLAAPIPAEGEEGQPGAIALIEDVKSKLGGVTQPGSKLAGELGMASELIIKARTSAISDNILSPYKLKLAAVLQVVGSFAFGLGLFSLLSIHGKAIAKRRKGWINSLGFYVAVFSMIILGLMNKYVSVKTPSGEIATSLYHILFYGGLTALQATMFSLVAFYIVSAAYRAFRIRSLDAVIMMVSAFLVMLAVVPVGMAMTRGLHGSLTSLRLENIGDWIMTIPNMAAQRGMQFGISVGGLAMALRIWLSLERGSYFDKQM